MTLRLNKTIQAGLMLCLLFLALALCAPDASAHRMRAALSIAEYDADTGRMELTHELHLHDAQFALNRITSDPSASLFEIEHQAALLLHARESFTMAADGAVVAFEPIGAEINGDHIFLYLESTPIKAPKAVRVRHDVLRAVFPEQINQINITVGPVLRTLILRKEGEEKNSLF